MRLGGKEAESSGAPNQMRGFFAPLRMTTYEFKMTTEKKTAEARAKTELEGRR
jgi:hypothetical protein